MNYDPHLSEVRANLYAHYAYFVRGPKTLSLGFAEV